MNGQRENTEHQDDPFKIERALLEQEVESLTRNYSQSEIISMHTGQPRAGAGLNEMKARACFRRLNEIRMYSRDVR